jgi:hypothetical protein
MKWFDALPENRSRGSFPRCLRFMEGDRTGVADRLTKLVGLPVVHVEPRDFWMPRGLPLRKADGTWDKSPIEEAKLGESEGFLTKERREKVTTWWLVVRERANTPNWDIASTCTIDGKPGLLLIEAKAHSAELKAEGKPREKKASSGSLKNHEQIGRAIAEASAELSKAMAGCNLSRDSLYQLANRFAWAWKIVSMGVPVVLVYLGFVGATDVSDLGKPFTDCADWTRAVLEHSRGVVPEEAWGGEIKIGGAAIRPLIRACKQDIPEQKALRNRHEFQEHSQE